VKKDEKNEEKHEKTEQKVIEKDEKMEDISNLEDLLDSEIISEKVEEVENGNDILSEIETESEIVEPETLPEEEKFNPNNIMIEEALDKAENKVDNVIDMSLTSLDDLIDILLKESFDFIIVEPFDDYAKVSFKKDGEEVLVKNINIRIYSKVIFKAKQIGKLNLDKDDIEQKAETPYSYKELDFKALVKVVPSSFGEKLFFKPKVMSKAKKTKKKEKI
jgi:type II secretory ATPase GspE/PulE/Tfp pilus assembly ATPase PilB-like protein